MFKRKCACKMYALALCWIAILQFPQKGNFTFLFLLQDWNFQLSGLVCCRVIEFIFQTWAVRVANEKGFPWIIWGLFPEVHFSPQIQERKTFCGEKHSFLRKCESFSRSLFFPTQPPFRSKWWFPFSQKKVLLASRKRKTVKTSKRKERKKP